MTLADLAHRLNASRTASGYQARCPAHEDDRPSLSITERDGKILLHCHAGCDFETILSALHLTPADLHVRSNGHPRSPIVATYDYQDLTGTVCYRKHRHADKTFHFAQPDGTPTVKGVARLVYRLPALRDVSAEAGEAARAWIVEGEKDADRLWSLGLPATTNDAGAGKWKATDTKHLRTIGITEAVCIPDCDDPGRDHMQAVAASLHAAGITVRIVDLPGEHPKGYDVSDWLNDGHTADELIALAEGAPVYVPADVPESRPAPIVTDPRTRAEVHAVFGKWLGEGYDLDALDAVIAAAAAERLDGDPLWLLLISGPGNAKTETVMALRGIGAITVSTILSEGALLSASPKRERTKDATGGLLRQIGSRGLLAIKDVTSILSQQSNTRAGVLAAFREVHDGKWVRLVGVEGGKTLTWEGRIVIIGACTTAWDTAHAVTATMGDRFVLLRMDSHIGRDSGGRHAIDNTGSEVTMRQELAEAVAGLIGTVDPTQAIRLTDDEIDQVLEAANITTLCRTGVEYDYRGDPTEAHAPEMPTRFAKQLTQIIRGGVAVGMTRDDAMRLAIRCARDSMPPIRLAILKYLWRHPDCDTKTVAAALEMPRSTVKRQLESLQLLQVLVGDAARATYEESIEVDDATPTATKRRIRERQITRYRVKDGLRAAAFGLEHVVMEGSPF
jgi:hypothetical protein